MFGSDCVTTIADGQADWQLLDPVTESSAEGVRRPGGYAEAHG
jgi:hypothetical protein